MKLSLDALIPEPVLRQGPDVTRRARAVAVATAIVGVISAYTAWVQIAVGSKVIGGVALLLALNAFAGFEYVRRTGRWRAVGASICAGTFLATGAIVASTGGSMAAASFYLGIVPVIGTIFFGARIGGALVLVNIAFLTLIETMRRDGFAFSVSVPQEIVAQSAYRGALIFEIVLFAIAFIYDVLRRASLDDVAESEARYTALTTQSTNLVFELDTSGVIRHIPLEHAAALGWTAAEMVGRPARDFLHEEDRYLVSRHISAMLRNATLPSDDLRLRHRDGSWHWYGASATLFETPDGAPHVLVIARNVDDRLDHEQRYRQAQKMDAVGQLASGVAHDFNNLLMVVSSYAQMLSEELEEGDQRESVREILKAAEQGEALTRQLVAVSRPGSQSPSPIDANAVIRRAERILTRIAGEDVSVEFALREDLPPVLADPGHLDQILVNLAVNARDAMPHGGVLLIRTTEVDDVVKIQVVDTGTGIEPEVRERIFEAFYTTKSRQHGTGLGLYFVYTLVQEMGGRIDVDSEVDAGTTITISLPSTRQLAAVSPERLDTNRPVVGGSETILLVEDRAQLRTIVGRVLSEAGYRVVDACNGADGIERARGHEGRIDLVLSDIVMPEMNGPEMARVLRKELEGARFLFMSGHSERAREVAEELSEDKLIAKPIVPPELLRRVRDALDRAA